MSFSRSMPILLLREVRSIDGAKVVTYPALGFVVSRFCSIHLPLSTKCAILSSKGKIGQMACDIGQMYKAACRQYSTRADRIVNPFERKPLAIQRGIAKARCYPWGA